MAGERPRISDVASAMYGKTVFPAVCLICWGPCGVWLLQGSGSEMAMAGERQAKMSMRPVARIAELSALQCTFN